MIDTYNISFYSYILSQEVKVLVTGGSGFIGRHIIRQCNEKGWETVSLDIQRKNNEAHTHFIGSINDKHLLKSITTDCDAIFHLAATTSPPQFEEIGNSGYENNVMGTQNVFDIAYDNGCKRVVYASSSAVYGVTKKASSEQDIPDRYENMYPVTKRINELTAKFYAETGKIETVGMRFFNTYGKDETSKSAYASVIWRFFTDIKNGIRPKIFGDGSQSRDFIHVEDTSRAAILAMEKGLNGEIYNVGTGRTNSFNTIFKTVAKVMDYRAEPEYVKNPLKNYQFYTCADITKANMEMGFTPELTLEKGIDTFLH